MCLAIYKPAKLKLSESCITNGWLRNPDGAGFAYIERGKVKIDKGYMTLKEFQAAYAAAAKKYSKSPFLVHFRIRTQGDRSTENTHPFALPTGALIHNGSLTGTGSKYDQGPSDTSLYVEKYKDYLTYEFVEKHKAEWDTILSYNKLAMLFDDGRHQIINERDGLWKDDIWFSNNTFQELKNSYHHNGASYSSNYPRGAGNSADPYDMGMYRDD